MLPTSIGATTYKTTRNQKPETLNRFPSDIVKIKKTESVLPNFSFTILCYEKRYEEGLHRIGHC